VKVLTHGVYNDSDGFGSDLTEGKKMFLSTSAGAITATAPSSTSDRVQVCGIAIGPRDVFVNPSLDTIEHA
jgi:putative NADPH-quinone reductase